MIKKTALLCALAANVAMHADVSLETHLLVAKDDYQRKIERVLYIPEESNTVQLDDGRDGHLLECDIIAYEEDGVIIQFKVFNLDNKETPISEPILKCIWDKETGFESTSFDGNAETAIQVTVIASRN